MGKIALLIILFVTQNSHGFSCDTKESSSDRLIGMVSPDGEMSYWNIEEARNLSFCIDDRFSEAEEKISNALKKAALEWMKFANVDFQLRDDLSCKTNSNVLFKVIPAPRRARYSARAFFPHHDPSKRILRIKRKYINDNSEADAFRLMLHELGHILGFRHEQIHPDQGGTCPEKSDGGFKPITDYDPLSVMHYSICKKNGVKNYVLSDLDKAGASLIYPK